MSLVTTTSPHPAGPAGSVTLKLQGTRPRAGRSLTAVYTLAD